MQCISQIICNRIYFVSFSQYKKAVRDIKSGKYLHGQAKPTDRRTSERPYSAMSYHSRELSRISQKEDISPRDISDIKVRKKLNRPITKSINLNWRSYVFLLVVIELQLSLLILTTFQQTKDLRGLGVPLGMQSGLNSACKFNFLWEIFLFCLLVTALCKVCSYLDNRSAYTQFVRG